MRIKNIICGGLSLTAALFSPSASGDSLSDEDTHSADIVVYGGTSASIIAAVQARKLGKSVIVVSPDTHLGGLSSGGLGWSDTGNKAVIGGLARDFYHRIWQYYQLPETWKWQNIEEYGNRGQGTPAIDGDQKTMWIFEPRIAEKVFEDYVREYNIPVHRDEWLDRANGVHVRDGVIQSITTLSGHTYSGKIFLDTTYEGDLMAAAGVDYHVGRESVDTYDEEWNGVQTGVLHHRHHFGTIDQPISPYVIEGDPSSGILPRINPDHPGEKGAGDHRVQAYCFRMCLTDHPENRIPFEKPEGYDPYQYELLVRIFEAGWRETFQKFDPIPNQKTDSNNHGPFSTDNIGYNYDYPEATYERRREIIKEHETYQKGWLYFIANDPRIPEEVQTRMQQWGLAKDEFVDNDGWPHQLYIREARRMIGEFVMTENELRKRRPTPDSVGMGSYTIDSHNVQRYITPEGYVQNEGDIGVSTNGPYEIAYGSLVPRKEQIRNLLVPVCVSSSHIAFGSIRMEPVFMILAQSATTAASMAIDEGIAVQEVNYTRLREQLEKDGQILAYDGPIAGGRGIQLSSLDGIVVDNLTATLTGEWQESTSHTRFVGSGYLHDGNSNKGQSTALFETTIKKGGSYTVRFGYPPHGNRATNVRVTVTHADGEETLVLNQKEPPSHDLFHELGTFRFDEGAGASVKITNEATDGYVVLDAVQWLPAEID